MQTILIGSTPSGGNQAAIDPAFGALRATVRPLDHTVNAQNLGHYKATVVTGTTVSVGAKGILAYLRWSTATAFAVITRLTVNASYIGSTIATGTIVDIAAYIRRGSTAAGSGGNAVTVGGNNQKMRGSMGGSLITDMRVATTAALTAPTGGTQDANPIAYMLSPATFQTTAPASGTPVTATLQTIPQDLYAWNTQAGHPIVLSNGDDIEFCEFTAGPTTGGIVWAVTFEWAELAAF